MDGTDINHSDKNHNQTLLAAATDKGEVCVYKYPAPVDYNMKHVVGKGHSSHVTKVKFNKDSSYLFSAGGNDTAIMQWRISEGSDERQIFPLEKQLTSLKSKRTMGARR